MKLLIILLGLPVSWILGYITRVGLERDESNGKMD